MNRKNVSPSFVVQRQKTDKGTACLVVQLLLLLLLSVRLCGGAPATTVGGKCAKAPVGPVCANANSDPIHSFSPGFVLCRSFFLREDVRLPV